VVETVTMRCEGPIKSVRELRRELELSGLDVKFGSQGVSLNDPKWPGQMENGRWFQLVVSGPGCQDECHRITTTWSGSGSVFIV
jgi:hypothetical protein